MSTDAKIKFEEAVERAKADLVAQLLPLQDRHSLAAVVEAMWVAVTANLISTAHSDRDVFERRLTRRIEWFEWYARRLWDDDS
jgi:hypothetical protein